VAVAAAAAAAGEAASSGAPAAASPPGAVATMSPLGVEREGHGDGAGGGALTLNASAPDASAAALVTAPIDLAWLDLRYSVSVSAPAAGGSAAAGAQTVQRELLAGVTGFARAGELTAIIGRSGAGKTTLLDVLAGLKTQGSLSGDVFLGGARVASPADVARVAGYVQQDDVHLATATVRETLLFSAALRLPAAVSRDARTAFVERVMRDLELDLCANRCVGRADEAGGLTPGERKRLSIGVELAANPPVLLLDEPTSGLDARAAAVVVRTLRRVAAQGRGRAVLATIHQPSAEVLGLFDSLLLLHVGGAAVFSGPLGKGAARLRDHFAAASGEASPAGKNPGNWALELLATEEAARVARAAGELPGAGPAAAATATATAADRFVAAYAGSEMAAATRAEVERQRGAAASAAAGGVGDVDAEAAGGGKPVVVVRARPAAGDAAAALPSSPPRRGELARFLALLWRTHVSFLRDVTYGGSRAAALIVMGLLLGGVYQRSAKILVSGDLQTRMGLWFTGLAFAGTIHFATALPAAFARRALFERECRGARMYAPEALGAAVLLVELLWVSATTAVFSAIFYALVVGEPGLLASFLGPCVLLSLCFNALALLLAALAPTAYAAQVLGYFVIGLWILFGGLFVTGPSLPAGWRWLLRANPLSHAFFATVQLQMWCTDALPEAYFCPSFVIPPLTVDVSRWAFVRDWLGLQSADSLKKATAIANAGIGNVALFYVAFAAAAVLAPRFVSHTRR
jgi:ABC-type multidrug transport system ATPase subunit/ABC-type multidrug transport system permease subunit